MHLMAHMVRCATVSALSCGAPCVTDVVYCVALLGARAPSARPRRRRRERHENRNRVSEKVHLKHGMHRNVYAVTYSRTAARRAQPEMHYCELSTCWQSRASPTADPAQRQERQHGPPHSSRTPKAPEHCPPQRIHTSVPLVAQWAGTWAMLSSRAREQSSAADAPVTALIPQFLERFNHHD